MKHKNCIEATVECSGTMTLVGMHQQLMNILELDRDITIMAFYKHLITTAQNDEYFRKGLSDIMHKDAPGTKKPGSMNRG